MFGIGTPEIIIIIVVALLIFGPSKLPDLGKSLGKGLREFKKATTEFKDQVNPLNNENNEDEKTMEAHQLGLETNHANSSNEEKPSAKRLAQARKIAVGKKAATKNADSTIKTSAKKSAKTITSAKTTKNKKTA